MAWSMSLLDDVFTMVIKSLPMEKACRTYLSLNRLIMHLQEEDCVSTEASTIFTISSNLIHNHYVLSDIFFKTYMKQSFSLWPSQQGL